MMAKVLLKGDGKQDKEEMSGATNKEEREERREAREEKSLPMSC